MKLITLLLSLTVSTALSLKAQVSCLCSSTPDNITISPGWPKIIPLTNGDDVIWDIEPLDINEDGTVDGYIVAGSADVGGSDGKNIYVRRFNANGTV